MTCNLIETQPILPPLTLSWVSLTMSRTGLSIVETGDHKLPSNLIETQPILPPLTLSWVSLTMSRTGLSIIETESIIKCFPIWLKPNLYHHHLHYHEYPWRWVGQDCPFCTCPCRESWDWSRVGPCCRPGSMDSLSSWPACVCWSVIAKLNLIKLQSIHATVPAKDQRPGTIYGPSWHVLVDLQ